MKRCCFADLDGMTASDRWFNDQSEPQFSSRSCRVGASCVSLSSSIRSSAAASDVGNDVGQGNSWATVRSLRLAAFIVAANGPLRPALASPASVSMPSLRSSSQCECRSRALHHPIHSWCGVVSGGWDARESTGWGGGHPPRNPSHIICLRNYGVCIPANANHSQLADKARGRRGCPRFRDTRSAVDHRLDALGCERLARGVDVASGSRAI